MTPDLRALRQVRRPDMQAVATRVRVGGLEDMRDSLDLPDTPRSIRQPGAVPVLLRVVVLVLFLGSPTLFNEARDRLPEPECSFVHPVHPPCPLIVLSLHLPDAHLTARDAVPGPAPDPYFPHPGPTPALMAPGPALTPGESPAMHAIPSLCPRSLFPSALRPL